MINAILQWIWLNEFLRSTRYPYWGFQILRDLSVGYDWQATGHFPRVTHCDFSQRKASSFNVSESTWQRCRFQLESVLCVLTLNVYYEKIFLFLWFWLLFVALVTSASAVYWILLFCFNQSNKRLIRRYLAATESAQLEHVSYVPAPPPSAIYVSNRHIAWMKLRQTSPPVFAAPNHQQQHPIGVQMPSQFGFRPLDEQQQQQVDMTVDGNGNEPTNLVYRPTPYQPARPQCMTITTRCSPVEFEVHSLSNW